MTEYTIHHDPAQGLTVTARPGRDGVWLVNFTRRAKTHKMLDQCAAWLPSGHWDDTRWHPVGARLVPPAALAQVEAWLQNRTALQGVGK